MPRICSANASRTLACRLRRSARPARKRCARRWSIPGSSTDRMAGASTGPVAQNRRARHDYFIDEVIEAGIVLEGSEVKALRKGSVSLNESYRSEEHTSELQSLMRISYAVFCLKK